MSLSHCAVVIAALLTAPVSHAQNAVRITPAAIDGHLRLLSSDLLEGRAPATRGSFFQEVPIDIVGAAASSVRVAASGTATAALVVHRFGTLLANAPGVATWNRDAEFRSPRARVQP